MPLLSETRQRDEDMPRILRHGDVSLREDEALNSGRLWVVHLLYQFKIVGIQPTLLEHCIDGP